MPAITVERLHPTAQLPTYATAGAAGADVRACLVGAVLRGRHAEDGKPEHVYAAPYGTTAHTCTRCGRHRDEHAPAVVLAPGERKRVGTGLILGIPTGFEVQVRPRSGLALNHGVTTANSPGTVDSDYRGELQVALVNLDPKVPHLILDGDRIAQLVVAPVTVARFVAGTVDKNTVRGAGGFGSTGRV